MKLKSLTPLLTVVLVVIMAATATADVKITDTRGKTLHFGTPPERAVSLVPSTTEVICNLGAADALAGVTFHSTLPRQKNDKPVVGGFSSPDITRILALDPDAVFVSSFQRDTIDQLEQQGIKTVCLDIHLL